MDILELSIGWMDILELFWDSLTTQRADKLMILTMYIKFSFQSLTAAPH